MQFATTTKIEEYFWAQANEVYLFGFVTFRLYDDHIYLIATFFYKFTNYQRVGIIEM